MPLTKIRILISDFTSETIASLFEDLKEVSRFPKIFQVGHKTSFYLTALGTTKIKFQFTEVQKNQIYLSASGRIKTLIRRRYYDIVLFSNEQDL